MLAKPEYSSQPDEVCCWQGRRGRAAGRGAVAELLAGAPWRSCWYGQPAEAAGGSAAGGMERSGSLCGKVAAPRATMRLHRRRTCRWASDDAAVSRKSLPLGERRRCGKGMVQSIIGKRLNGSNQHFTPFLFQCHRPHIAIPIIIKYKRAA